MLFLLKIGVWCTATWLCQENINSIHQHWLIDKSAEWLLNVYMSSLLSYNLMMCHCDHKILLFRHIFNQVFLYEWKSLRYNIFNTERASLKKPESSSIFSIMKHWSHSVNIMHQSSFSRNLIQSSVWWSFCTVSFYTFLWVNLQPNFKMQVVLCIHPTLNFSVWVACFHNLL